MARHKGIEVTKHHEMSTISMHAWNDMLEPLSTDDLQELQELIDKVTGVSAIGFSAAERLASLSLTQQEDFYRIVQEMKNKESHA